MRLHRLFLAVTLVLTVLLSVVSTMAQQPLNLGKRGSHQGQSAGKIFPHLQGIGRQGQLIPDERKDGNIERFTVSGKRLVGTPPE